MNLNIIEIVNVCRQMSVFFYLLDEKYLLLILVGTEWKNNLAKKLAMIDFTLWFKQLYRNHWCCRLLVHLDSTQWSVVDGCGDAER